MESVELAAIIEKAEKTGPVNLSEILKYQITEKSPTVTFEKYKKVSPFKN